MKELTSLTPESVYHEDCFTLIASNDYNENFDDDNPVVDTLAVSVHQETDSAKVIQCSEEDKSMLVDSGATSHITKDDDFIDTDDTYKPENHYIELADGSVTCSAAKKRGSVLVNFTDVDGVVHNQTLKDVLYCPDYPQNIYSVRAATKSGAAFLFSEDCDELRTPEGFTFPIRRKCGLYYLYSVSSKCPNIRACGLDQWHKILGHCNIADILKLESVVDGMKITNKKAFHCSSCVVGKQTRNMNKAADPRATAPVEFMHSDLSGPIEPVAKDGFKHVMTFTDDYSSAIFVYFLKHKDDAVGALKKVLADSAPFGKMKRLRSDNGGEYVSEEFKEIMIENCVNHQNSAPYCPHQNGTAEREVSEPCLRWRDVCSLMLTYLDIYGRMLSWLLYSFATGLMFNG